jgi:hypothetical protein
VDGTDDKRFAKFRAIDKDGICLVGEPLDNGTIMVNKGKYSFQQLLTDILNSFHLIKILFAAMLPIPRVSVRYVCHHGWRRIWVARWRDSSGYH